MQNASHVQSSRRPITAVHPRGGPLSIADLPPVDTRRWVASKKAIIVAAITQDMISVEAVLAKYPNLSEEELQGWIARYTKRGIGGLGLKQTLREREGQLRRLVKA